MERCARCGTFTRAGRACPSCGGAGAIGLSAAALLLLGGCFLKPEEQALYGVPNTGLPESAEDVDGDGFTVAQGDCNDADDTVFPGAEDVLGDGLDTDCDNEDG